MLTEMELWLIQSVKAPRIIWKLYRDGLEGLRFIYFSLIGFSWIINCLKWISILPEWMYWYSRIKYIIYSYAKTAIKTAKTVFQFKLTYINNFRKTNKRKIIIDAEKFKLFTIKKIRSISDTALSIKIVQQMRIVMFLLFLRTDSSDCPRNSIHFGRPFGQLVTGISISSRIICSTLCSFSSLPPWQHLYDNNDNDNAAAVAKRHEDN